MIMKIDNIQLLGKFIMEARKKQKLTQEQLAAISGVGIRFGSPYQDHFYKHFHDLKH